MEHEHFAAMAIDLRIMTSEVNATQWELRRPFYLVRAEMHNRGKDYFEATYGGVSGFGKTPQAASIAFDLVWLNGSIDKAAVEAQQEPNMDSIKTHEINVLVKENRELIEDRLVLVTALSKIARPRDCGCMPCKDQCVSREALLIEAEEMRETARAALMRTPPFEREET